MGEEGPRRGDWALGSFGLRRWVAQARVPGIFARHPLPGPGSSEASRRRPAARTRLQQPETQGWPRRATSAPRAAPPPRPPRGGEAQRDAPSRHLSGSVLPGVRVVGRWARVDAVTGLVAPSGVSGQPGLAGSVGVGMGCRSRPLRRVTARDPSPAGRDGSSRRSNCTRQVAAVVRGRGLSHE